MGGHGGLNILPQKSWNVYGRENRLKVARDEAQHAEEEQARMEKQREAESQARRIYLLQQAAKKRGETFELPQAAVGPQPRLAPEAEAVEPSLASTSATEEPSAAATDSAVAVREEQPTLLQHINFFAEHEAKEAHPEKLEEAKREARRRGDKKTQTSDAKFDEKFQVGHGISGKANKPWYAKSSAMLQPEGAPGLQGSAVPAALLHSRAALSGAATSESALLQAASSLTDKQRRKAEKAARREEKRRRHAERAAQKGRHRGSQLKQGAGIERLRQERQVREAAERERARQAVLQDARARGVLGDGKRFHSAYGNAARRAAAV
ncbi:hypothetical protein CVIRNUC_009845 [Coccomyxa viridis]|uniref:CBF1-interacting co-repressor CIR N-terminal domain-containing protein n=1 Tax=Coccomyxa viridis TaxID=1274662 RepID=A0AAV1IH37_9CHLO|nr:hypothetical protein CVIRNUC_009845 [Coccomyxa viridis]